jgi:predicted Rossmann fold nucleotide-binding protein DprA/Smf involved in DNA uptake
MVVMVRIGRFILFERSGEESQGEALDENPTSLMIMSQQVGALQNEIKHRLEWEQEQEKRISDLEKKIIELSNPRLRKDNYEPPDDLIDRIIAALDGEAMTSTEIREQVHANANRTIRALRELQGAGKVKTRSEGRKKLFYLVREDI